MESLLQNAQLYAQLLKRCRTEEVANWKPQDLERALHWARYFKNVRSSPCSHEAIMWAHYSLFSLIFIYLQVYEKTKEKRSVRQRLDSHLSSLGAQMGISFGTERLCFEFMAQGVDYLIKVSLCCSCCMT